MKVIAIDQSTSATKALLFTEQGELLKQVSVAHQQYYPQTGWVEHDAEEIYQNTLKAMAQLVEDGEEYSIAITNQRETVVVWDKASGKPVSHAVVWQCMRGADICNKLKEEGYTAMVQEKSGLLIDPYFSASGVKWILDNIEGAREAAQQGRLLMGTIDAWLVWKLTEGRVHATDHTNASRTLLFNIHTLDWDDDLLELFTIPRCMMPEVRSCDAVYGVTTAEGLFKKPAVIAGVLGDSHGALAGQMCFVEGLGKATYGTGSSVMVNIGEHAAAAPDGLVTSVGFSALGKTFYAFEGNIHCTGATIKWMADELELIDNPNEIEQLATSVENNGGVYFVPAFAGLGAPWWNPKVNAMIYGLTLGTGKKHVCRAALESIAYQITDLLNAMTEQAGIELRELRVDGGPTRNRFLMQFQADLLRVNIVRSGVDDASAFGAFLMNGFARGKWTNFMEAKALWHHEGIYEPQDNRLEMIQLYSGWRKAINQLIK